MNTVRKVLGDKPMTGWEAAKVCCWVLFWGAVIVVGLTAAQKLVGG